MKGDFPLPEIIYVDSASTDGSVGRARSLGVQIIALEGSDLNAAKGRNAGWRAAKEEYILFLDGDTEVGAVFVEKTKDFLKDPKIAAVWGDCREMFPEKNFYHRVCDLDWRYPYGESEYFGGNVLIRRKVLEEVGGYDESLRAGEEPEMCGRIRKRGYRIIHLDLPMTLHDIHMKSWREYWRRAERSGYAYAEVISRFPGSAPDSWGSMKWHNVFHVVILMLGTGACLVLSFFAKSAWPLLCWLALIFLVVLRTARKARWKSSDPASLFYYSVHSHIAKIPLAWGQVKYWLDRNKSR